MRESSFVHRPVDGGSLLEAKPVADDGFDAQTTLRQGCQILAREAGTVLPDSMYAAVLHAPGRSAV